MSVLFAGIGDGGLATVVLSEQLRYTLGKSKPMAEGAPPQPGMEKGLSKLTLWPNPKLTPIASPYPINLHARSHGGSATLRAAPN